MSVLCFLRALYEVVTMLHKVLLLIVEMGTNWGCVLCCCCIPSNQHLLSPLYPVLATQHGNNQLQTNISSSLNPFLMLDFAQYIPAKLVWPGWQTAPVLCSVILTSGWDIHCLCGLTLKSKSCFNICSALATSLHQTTTPETPPTVQFRFHQLLLCSRTKRPVNNINYYLNYLALYYTTYLLLKQNKCKLYYKLISSRNGC